MTPEDREHIDEHYRLLNNSIQDMAKEVHSIKRGVYGDRENKVPGLIELTPRVQSLEDSRKKALWVGGGIIAFLEFVWHFIKDGFK